jgi:8-oxo-dGTP pyrophosphatase MutT (NUDIX family)
MFGGQIEAGENSHAAALREISEELVYVPASLEYFPQQFRSDVNAKVFDVFVWF